MNKFNIICCSYNNEKWAETHLESILEQTYTNYEVIYINDASTDKTMEIVEKLVGNDKRFHLINNKTNLDSTTNYFKYAYEFMENKDDEILVELCGDDWFATPDVLSKLNDVYNSTDCWLTYGGMRVWQGGNSITLPDPQNGNYSELVHKHAMYRKDSWKAGHLHSFRWFAHKAFSPDDAISYIDKTIYKRASDLQLLFSIMEMIPSNKIQNLDFPTVMFNNSPRTEQIVVGTDFRDGSKNEEYESEIRNRKKYKRVHSKEELKGEKLPQINTFTEHSELASIPSKFSYCYNQLDGDFDALILNDSEILEYLSGSIKINKKVPIIARLHEHRDYFNRNIMNAVISNHEKFHTILTYDKIILESVPNAKFCNIDGISQFVLYPNQSGIPPYHSKLFDTFDVEQTIQIYPKNIFNKASCITSAKNFLPGHSTRLNFIQNIKNKVDLFGRGIREIPSKLDALHNYAFTVAIENNTATDDYYFTEKLIECFVTGTVPIYHGCPNIGEFFDVRGVLTFSNQTELDYLLDNLTEEKYNSMSEYIHSNFNKCVSNMVIHADSLYDLHLNQIVKG